MKSIYTPDDWAVESVFLKNAAGGQPVNDDMVARLKVKLVKQVLDSHLFFMRNYAQTVDKHTSELVLMDPFYGQAGLDYTIECQRRAGYAQRVVEIKPRQVGWTTALLSRGVWTCLHPRRNTVLFVPDSEVAEDMMRRVGTIINCLPDWLRPMKRIDRTGLIEFDNPNHRERERDPGLQSRFLCLVPTDFRGASNLNMVILSEFAKYNKTMHGRVQEFLDALMSGIAESDNTCVVIDTTPMGHDPVYAPMAKAACERNPQWVKRWYKRGRRSVQEVADGVLGTPDRPQDWVPWFSRWIDHPAYSTKDDHPRGELPALTPLDIDELLRSERKIGSREEYGNDEEIELMQKDGATLGNIAWRRNKIDKNPGPDFRYRKLGFDQEFARTHLDCFVSYGKTPFDPLGLEAIHKMILDPYATGIMRDGPNGPYLDTTFRSDWQEVRLWTNPGDDAFIIGVDLATAYNTVEADDTFAQVLRRWDQKQVAVYQAKVPPTELRQQLYLLYKYFNNALMVVETDAGVGYSLVRELYDMGCTNQYMWTRLDKDIPTPTDYMGWETNPKTRPIMQETLVEEINRRTPDGKASPGVIIRDLETYEQLTNLERDPSGFIEGTGRSHDDAAVSMMFTLTANRAPWHAFTMPKQASEEVDPKTRGGALMQDYLNQPKNSTRMYVEPGVGREEKESGDAA